MSDQQLKTRPFILCQLEIWATIHQFVKVKYDIFSFCRSKSGEKKVNNNKWKHYTHQISPFISSSNNTSAMLSCSAVAATIHTFCIIGALTSNKLSIIISYFYCYDDLLEIMRHVLPHLQIVIHAICSSAELTLTLRRQWQCVRNIQNTFSFLPSVKNLNGIYIPHRSTYIYTCLKNSGVLLSPWW